MLIASPPVVAPINSIGCKSTRFSVLSTVIKFVPLVVAVTDPFGYALPGSAMRTSVTTPPNAFTRPSAVAPVFTLAPAVVLEETTDHNGVALALPNAKLVQLLELGNVRTVQLIPSGLVAPTVPCATAKNNPCP